MIQQAHYVGILKPAGIRRKSTAVSEGTQAAMKRVAQKKVIEDVTAGMGSKKNDFIDLVEFQLNSKNANGLKEASIPEFKLAVKSASKDMIYNGSVRSGLREANTKLSFLNKNGNIVEYFHKQAEHLVRDVMKADKNSASAKILSHAENAMEKGAKKSAAVFLQAIV